MNPNYCDKCGQKVISENDRFCGKCGADLTKMPANKKIITLNPDVDIENQKESLKKDLSEILSDKSIDEKTKIKRIIHATGLSCGFIALQPIPIADIFILTPIQAAMVLYIGKVKGLPIDKKRAKQIVGEISAVVGAGLLAQHAVIIAYKTFLPFAGGLFTLPLVWGFTYGIGKAAETYYDIKKDATGELDEKSRKKIKDAYGNGLKDGKNVYESKAEQIKTELEKRIEAESSARKKAEEKAKNLEDNLLAAEKLLEEAMQKEKPSEETVKEIKIIYEKQSPKDKIELFSRLLKEYKLYPKAKEDLENMVSEGDIFYRVFNDIITFERNPNNLPSGMKVQKYHSAKDILEIKASDKFRFYVSANKKLIVRIDVRHEHGKMENWFKNSEF